MNALRRQRAADRQQPIPIDEQRRRAGERKAAHQARYPHAPAYNPWVAVGGKQPNEQKADK